MRIGYPVVIRPSYVLGGRAMEIVHDAAGLDRYMRASGQRVGHEPGADRPLSAGRDRGRCRRRRRRPATSRSPASWSISRKPGSIPATAPARCRPIASLAATIAEIERQTVALAQALGVVGLMNVQFAVKDGDIYVLEVNPRASRTVPFVAKATGVPIAKIAARVMAGEHARGFPTASSRRGLAHVAVKEAVFPFARFPGVDLILGPEMKSTGEVMGLDARFRPRLRQVAARQRHRLAARGLRLRLGARPRQGGAGRAMPAARRDGVRAGRDTKARPTALRSAGLPVTPVNKVREGRPHIVDRMLSGGVQLVFNTTEGPRRSPTASACAAPR